MKIKFFETWFVLLLSYVYNTCYMSLLVRYHICVKRNLTTKRPTIKNSIHSRLSSTRYAVAITLHSVFNHSYENDPRLESKNEKQVCFYCDTSLASKARSVDHIFPVIVNKKPSNRMVLSKWNEVVCCVACNSRKSNHDCIGWMKKNRIETDKILEIEHKMQRIGQLSETDYNQLLNKFETFMLHHEIQCNTLLLANTSCTPSVIT